MAELCSGDIVADIRTIYQSKIGSESGRAGAQSRPNMDTASLVSDHHQFSSFLQLTLFLDTLHLSTHPLSFSDDPFWLSNFTLYLIVSTNFFGSFYPPIFQLFY